MPRPRTLAAIISSAVQALSNCQDSGNPWQSVWSDRLDWIADNLLPSGSGIDNGTQIEIDDCKADRIVLSAGFHHMNDGGFYDGWTQHKITIRPAFDGIDIAVSGRNRNEIKDYLAETYHYCLNTLYTIGEDGKPIEYKEAQTV